MVVVIGLAPFEEPYRSSEVFILNSYVWRSCAGCTCDAIQFATQMGFATRTDGVWHLALSDMLRFFGGEAKPNIVRFENGYTNVSTVLWDGDFELSMIASLVSQDENESPIDRTRLNLHITLCRCLDPERKKSTGYDMLADKRGVMFYCTELGGAICAAQLSQILAILGRAMDDHAKCRYRLDWEL